MPVANRIESFQVTVAAGVTQANAVTTDISVRDGQLQRIELTVPPGHNGQTGIQILAAEAQMIPFTFGAFLVANNEYFGWDMVGVIDTGSFQAKCFNLGSFPHSFYIRFSMLDFAYAPDSLSALPALIAPPALV